ncbi:MAG TPA: hypothetical protein VHC22_29495 [Pirellulales bacterium]|nr:hypothetical protein [Pirellulales bacterium]
MRNAWKRTKAVVFFAAFCVTMSGQSRGDEPDGADAARRQQRLEFLIAETDKFQIRTNNDELLKRGQQPILRWSNPVRDFVNDGITFLFFDGRRPRAIVTVWVRGRDPKLESGEQCHEFISLSPEPLSCRRDDLLLWSPKTGGVVDQTLADAPPPAARPAQRLAQMRELAKRFRAATYKTESANELRLLNQPLYRYPEQTAAVLDGGLFAFVEANDAEALLLLEAVAVDDGERYEWRYTLGRSTTFRVVVHLDEREVFAVGPYWQVRQKSESAYMEVVDGPFTLNGE